MIQFYFRKKFKLVTINKSSGSNFAQVSILLLAFVLLSLSKLSAQANSVRTNVTFNWANTQANVSDPANLESITIDSEVYNTFVVPSSYEMTRLGTGGHDGNHIKLNGTEVLGSSGAINWNFEALNAYQSLNLNHYFESNSNGDDFCEDYTAVSTSDTQIQTISYSPGIPSNPNGVLAVTERGGNNCIYIELWGTPVGGGAEQLLGQTFVINQGNLTGVNPQAPPTTNSDYWSSGRNNENDQIIGIALFKLSDLAPVGSTISSIKYHAATNDNGDGKFFLMQTYAIDDTLDIKLDRDGNGDIRENDNVPNGSTYSIVSTTTNGTLSLNTDGTFNYIPNPGYTGTDSFEYEVCLPAPNTAVCDTATVNIIILPDAIADSGIFENDSSNNRINILDNDDFGSSGAQNNNAITNFTTPSNGSISLNNNGTPSNPLDDYFTYTPNGGFSGIDTFTYEITDGAGHAATASVFISVAPDSDGDNVVDPKDVDDDNDGILDINESLASYAGDIKWTHNEGANRAGIDTIDPEIQDWVISSFTNESAFGSINTQVVGSELQITNVNSTDFTEAFSNNDYVEYTFTTSNEINDAYISNVFSRVIEDGASNFDRHSDSYKLSVLISEDNFSNYGVLASDISHKDSGNGPSQTDSFFYFNGWVNPAYVIERNKTYSFRIYFYDVTDDNTKNYIVFDDFTISVAALQHQNSDSDSLPDYLDEDSDADTCVDAIEAGHTDLDNDGVLGNSPISVDFEGKVESQGGYTGTNTRVTAPTQAVSITSQPSSQTINIGDNITYAVTASGTGLTYQWEESTDGGSNYNLISNGGIYSDATTTTLTLTGVSNTNNEYLYRAIITDSNNLCTPDTLSNSAELIIRPEITINDNSAIEGSDVEFTITASHSLSTPITFDVAYTNISTTNSDYTQVNSITLPANSTSVTLPIVTTNDDIIESNEFFDVTLSSLDPVEFMDNEGRGEIIDDDLTPGTDGLSITQTNVIVTEGPLVTATFDVTLTGQYASSFDVDFSTAFGTATATDFNPITNGTISFLGNDTEVQQITVTILNDGIIEPQEDYMVTLNSTTNTLVPINDATANGIINDDDATGSEGLSITQTNVIVTEGPLVTATFDVTLTGQYASGFDVDFSTAFGTATATDFNPITNGTISFLGNDTEVQQITVTILNDGIIEPQEDYMVTLNSTTNTLVPINDATANGIINDDDTTGSEGLSITQTNVIVTEGPLVTATFDVTLTGQYASGFDVDFSTAFGTATATDFNPITNGTISFLGNDTEVQQITVTILNDGIIEPQEDYMVTLNSTTNTLVPINDATANGIINDDDAIIGAGIAFTNTDVIVTEGTNAFAVFNVTLTGTISENVTVEYTTVDGSAINPGDITTTTGTITFTPTVNSFDIQVPIIDDVVIESTEAFTVVLSNVQSNLGLGIVGPDTANGTINDDDSNTGYPMDVTVDSCDAVPITDTIIIDRACDITLTHDNDVITGDADACPSEYTITRTWTVTNCNGGTTTHVQTITVLDRDNPVFVEALPADTMASCATVPTAETLTATDNCSGTATVIFDEQITDQDANCPFNYTITRTWTATDCAGNVAIHVQTITVQDIEAPVFIEELPANATVTCDTIPTAVTLTALDNCDMNASVAYTETISNDANCSLGYQITRTWTASDCSGNQEVHTQVITIPSNGPITSNPYEEEVTILCGDDIPEVPNLEFMGGCGGYIVDFTTEAVFSDDTDDYMIIRTWSVTDSCNNMAVFVQTIFIMQPERELVTIEICVEDATIDLINYLPENFDQNGTFVITTGDVTLNESFFNPSTAEVGEYTIAYSSLDGDCKYYVDFTIIVNADCVPCSEDQIKTSNTITANGDGVNDYFEITGVEFCNYTFGIQFFNRWGRIVYESNDYQNDWGGFAPNNSFGSSDVLPSGTYYYIINVKNSDIKPINGFIYLGAN